MTQHPLILHSILQAAIAAAHPRLCLPAHLPAPPDKGRLIVLAGGKAAGSMVRAVEESGLYDPGRLVGLGITRHGYGEATNVIPVAEAGHPVPDAAGLAATMQILELARSARADDLVLVLLSGGASANWIAPVEGVSLADKQALTKALLRSGAAIDEINAVRKHLSTIKGGRLARAACPAPIITLAISDVPGDDPAIIGSGPTVPDPSTLADAKAILTRYGIEAPQPIRAALDDPANESPKPGDPVFADSVYTLIARPADALKAAAQEAARHGYEPVVLGSDVQGEAQEVARQHARLALDMAQAGRKVALLSGGELTVTMRGDGEGDTASGGPNQEYALALALALESAPGIHALAADTDGIDGGSGAADDPAGAMIDPTTLVRAAASSLAAHDHLARNDSGAFFRALGDLVRTGPTRTNVNDCRIILVDGEAGMRDSRLSR